MFKARLVDPPTARNRWVGSGEVSAGGRRLFVGNGSSASSSVSAIGQRRTALYRARRTSSGSDGDLSLSLSLSLSVCLSDLDCSLQITRKAMKRPPVTAELTGRLSML